MEGRLRTVNRIAHAATASVVALFGVAGSFAEEQNVCRSIVKKKLGFLRPNTDIALGCLGRQPGWLVPQSLSTLPFFIAATSIRPIAATKMAGPPNCGTVGPGGSASVTKLSDTLKMGWTPPTTALVVPAHTPAYVPTEAVLGAPDPAVNEVG